MKKQQRFTRNAIALACATFSFCASNVYAASTLQKNADGTTYDTATGLTWKSCREGRTWDGTTCTGTAATYTFDAANALTGKVTFAGQSDWRVPNIRELLTRMDYTVTDNTGYWSSSLAAGDFFNSSFFNHPIPWYFNYNGGTQMDQNNMTNNVLLVRGGEQSSALLNLARPDADYTDNGDGTVTHKPTNLTWQRCMVGQTWNGTTCTGSSQSTTWANAKALTSSFAGKTDWRLPTKPELDSLVDYVKTTSPALNSTMFPNDPGSVVWSGSPEASPYPNPTGTWAVDFRYGESVIRTNNDPTPSYSHSVRLVRGGQSSAPVTLSDTDCFLNWAEARIPTLLTPHQTTQTAGTISYRGAYTSGMYIGVTGDSVLALGGSFGNTATTIGTLSSFLPTARAASCK